MEGIKWLLKKYKTTEGSYLSSVSTVQAVPVELGAGQKERPLKNIR